MFPGFFQIIHSVMIFLEFSKTTNRSTTYLEPTAVYRFDSYSDPSNVLRRWIPLVRLQKPKDPLHKPQLMRHLRSTNGLWRKWLTGSLRWGSANTEDFSRLTKSTARCCFPCRYDNGGLRRKRAEKESVDLRDNISLIIHGNEDRNAELILFPQWINPFFCH